MSSHAAHRDPARPLEDIQDARTGALALLDDTGVPPLDAVTWLSAHLSAVQHVLHPAVARVLHDRPAVAALRRSTTLIERSLRLLEQSLAGDAHIPALDRAAHRQALVASITAQAAAEQVLLDQLARTLPLEEQRRLVEDYQQALEHAPTRPHPHAPHGALLGALAFRVNGWRDRVMDTVDARRVPSPRPVPAPPVHSRWGDYALGGGSSAPTADQTAAPAAPGQVGADAER